MEKMRIFSQGSDQKQLRTEIATFRALLWSGVKILDNKLQTAKLRIYQLKPHKGASMHFRT